MRLLASRFRTSNILPMWLWCLVVAGCVGCVGDAGTTLWALRVGLSDYNPLYTNSAATPWLLLLTHGAVLILLGVLVRRGRVVALIAAMFLIGMYGLGNVHNLLAILPHLQHWTH